MIMKKVFSTEEINVAVKIAERAKMDWFYIDEENNFRSAYTRKKLSAAKSIKTILEGSTDYDKETLTDEEKNLLNSMMTN